MIKHQEHSRNCLWILIIISFISGCSDNKSGNQTTFDAKLAHAAEIQRLEDIPKPKYYGVYVLSDTNELVKLIDGKTVPVRAKYETKGLIFFEPSPQIRKTRLSSGISSFPESPTSTVHVKNTDYGYFLDYRKGIIKVIPIGKDMYFVDWSSNKDVTKEPFYFKGTMPKAKYNELFKYSEPSVISQFHKNVEVVDDSVIFEVRHFYITNSGIKDPVGISIVDGFYYCFEKVQIKP